ncbi:MAG TPA: N-acetyl-1-D-myo-inositol-2-amino-2-deoxy-alpha-D-glucopyranoside deacetylase [Pseudonocardiaceae bacterium]|nr:N-acetyl-1-D-myo-inositol-2-amino-2-deoxy-alpha-D-glucopyranoside deacetylase [Pseudonocardiaceae bacterium]
MLVHAHPDDETIGTGATMARYARDGATVILVTCTRGELGEIVAPELAGLRDGDGDGLAQHRESELAEALAQLGTQRFYWLGGHGRWRDSGMAGEPANGHPDAFAQADLDEAVRAMVQILRTERPQVVVTYDADGGYGHPDHVQANRVTMAALEPAADPAFAPELGAPWQVSKVYWTALARSMIERAVQAGALASVDEVPSRPDEEITTVLDAREHLAAKVAALRAHRSQVDMAGGVFATVAMIPEFAVESYVLVRGERGPGSGPHNWEDDLFAGLDAATRPAPTPGDTG